jgi:hypothetical protein
VSAIETFDDDAFHAEFWFVGADGTAKLAACDPTRDSFASQISGRPAFSDTAAYIGARHRLDATETTWSIVRIPR